MAGAVALECALVGLSGSAGAQDAKAEALVDKVIAVHGGMESWRILRDVTFTLTVIPLNPQEEVAGARVSLYRLMREGKARVETVMGRGLLVEGFDGERPWVVLDGKRRSAWLDYKREGPFMMYSKWIVYTNPQMTQRRTLILLRDFQFNTGLPDSLFTAP